MARVCSVTGKRPQAGQNVSHANNKSKRRFFPNLHVKRIWVPSEGEGKGRFIKLKVSSRGLRTIDKLGIEAVLEKINAGEYV